MCSRFPLYTKGTDRLQFQYAIYLLNKNIAQLRWYCGLPTFDLRATLPNLFSLLNGISDFRFESSDSAFGIIKYLSSLSSDYRSDSKSLSKKYGSFSTLDQNFGRSFDRLDSSNISSSYEQIFSPKVEFSPIRKVSRSQMSDSGPSLSQILVAPSNFKVRNDSSRFKNVSEVSSNCDNITKKVENPNPNCVDCNIEQGLDILDPSHNLICTSQNEHSTHENFSEIPISDPLINKLKMKRRISRSVGSITDDEKLDSNLEVGSDPLSKNLSSQNNFMPNLNLSDGRKEFLQSWFNNAELVCSDENLLTRQSNSESEATNQDREIENDLTIRTEALVQELSSFHLVRPKQN